MLIIPSVGFSQFIEVVDKNTVVGRLSIESLEKLVEASEKYKDIMQAQKHNRLTISLLNAVRETNIIGQYKTKIKISWFNDKGKEINYITVNVLLNIDNQSEATIPQWRIQYRNVAEYGFPISLLLILIAILL
jgi:hypothetical protein